MPEAAGGSATRWGPLFGAQATAWAETWEGPGGWGTPVYEHVLERAEIGPRTRVLDCGCGAGRFARMAADRGASVAGIDASEELIEIAAERAPEGDFRVGDIEALPWKDDSFDVATGLSSFQFADDKVRALTEAARVSRRAVAIVIPTRAPESGVTVGLHAGLPALRRRGAGEHEAEWDVRALGARQAGGCAFRGTPDDRTRTTRSSARSSSKMCRRRSELSWERGRHSSRSAIRASREWPRPFARRSRRSPRAAVESCFPPGTAPCLRKAEPVAAELERGRDLYVSQAWMDAYESFAAADRSDPLEAEDLELMATSAYMVGREAEYVVLLERAHGAYLGSGQPLAALRCAFWIGVTLAARGQVGHATGWLGRARRLLDREGGDRVERGYLLVPVAFEQEAEGDLEAAADTSARRRRSASASATRTCSRSPPWAGSFPDPDRAHERGSEVAGRGDGGRNRRRAVADRLGHRLLRRDPGVRGCLRGSPRSGVDGRSHRLVPTPVRPGGLHRTLSRASRRDHAARRARGPRLWRRHGGRSTAACRGRTRPRPAKRVIGRERSTDCSATRALPRRPTGKRADSGGSRSRASPCCGWRRGRLMPRRRRFAEWRPRPLSSVGERRLLPAFVEIMLAVGDVAAARGACSELESVAEGHESGALGASAAQARGAVD